MLFRSPSPTNYAKTYTRLGRITDEGFARMSASYETEHRPLETRVAELRTHLADAQDKQLNIDRFPALIRKYADIQELTSET